MLNGDKTLITVFAPHKQLAKLGPIQFQIREASLCSQGSKNLGVIFDQNLNFRSHVSSTKAYHQFYSIQKVHPNLT